MIVKWKQHAKEKFLERALQLGINYGDVEFEIKKQEKKIPQEKNKIKTIFKIRENLITIIKIENKKGIFVITLWNSSKKEEKIWKKKTNAFPAEEKEY